MFETVRKEAYQVETAEQNEGIKRLWPIITLLQQNAILMRKLGADFELLSFPKTSEPEVKDRVSNLEAKIVPMEREIRKLRKQLDDSVEIINLLKESFEAVVEKKVDEILEDIGFSPITSSVLSEYDDAEVEKCKSTIIEEIKLTSGITDADDIAKKYGFPLRLVAGCFDYLLSEGKIGQTEE